MHRVYANINTLPFYIRDLSIRGFWYLRGKQYQSPMDTGCTLMSRIAGLYGSSIFSVLRNHHLFSTAARPLYIPINSAQNLYFSTSSLILVIMLFFFFIVAILMDVRFSFATITNLLHTFYLNHATILFIIYVILEETEGRKV